jgi:NAD(P)-dependent dehydrogenase (short-subunit alcohol dehydrogenase family)
VEAIQASGAQANSVRMDVTDAASIAHAFAAAEARFGPVSILINNAGVTITRAALEVAEQDWTSVIDTNLKGAWLVAQHAAQRMIHHAAGGSGAAGASGAAGESGRASGGSGARHEGGSGGGTSAASSPAGSSPAGSRAGSSAGSRGGGSIVNIASILGLRVAGGVAPYAISKAGVVQMTKALALEWARHRIRVNALAPGYIETELNDEFFASDAGKALIRRIPQRRLGEATELDGPLLLLASDAGSYMTGSVLAVDGGHLVSGL